VVSHDLGRGGELLGKTNADGGDGDSDDRSGIDAKTLFSVGVLALQGGEHSTSADAAAPKSGSAKSKKRGKSGAGTDEDGSDAGEENTQVVMEAFNSTHIVLAGVERTSRRPIVMLWYRARSSHRFALAERD
jgi:hypothetical protein